MWSVYQFHFVLIAPHKAKQKKRTTGIVVSYLETWFASVEALVLAACSSACFSVSRKLPYLTLDTDRRKVASLSETRRGEAVGESEKKKEKQNGLCMCCECRRLPASC